MKVRNLQKLEERGITEEDFLAALDSEKKKESNLGKPCAGYRDENGFGQPCKRHVIVSLDTCAVIFSSSKDNAEYYIGHVCPECRRSNKRGGKRYMAKRRVDGIRVCTFDWQCFKVVHGGIPYCEEHHGMLEPDCNDGLTLTSASAKAKAIIPWPVSKIKQEMFKQGDIVPIRQRLAKLIAFGQADPRNTIFIDTEWARDMLERRLYITEFAAVDLAGNTLASWVSKIACPQYPSPSNDEILQLRTMVDAAFHKDSEVIEWSLSRYVLHCTQQPKTNVKSRCDHELMRSYCTVNDSTPESFPTKVDPIFCPLRAWIRLTPMLKGKHKLAILNHSCYLIRIGQAENMPRCQMHIWREI